MVEIPMSHPGLRALFAADSPNWPMLSAMLLGHNPGRAFADNAAHPAQAALRTQDALTFLSLRASQGFVDQALTQLRDLGHVGLVWRPAASAGRPAEPAKVIRRYEFSECALDEAALADPAWRLPEGFTLRPIDQSLMERCVWRPEIESACGSWENFLAHGRGLCLMRGDDIVTEAYAPFWGIEAVEIGVVTHEPYRGRGYAALTCAHLIGQCRQRGFAPYWSCDADNDASAKVARKLRFQRQGEYEIWLYRGNAH